MTKIIIAILMCVLCSLDLSFMIKCSLDLSFIIKDKKPLQKRIIIIQIINRTILTLTTFIMLVVEKSKLTPLCLFMFLMVLTLASIQDLKDAKKPYIINKRDMYIDDNVHDIYENYKRINVKPYTYVRSWICDVENNENLK